MRYGRSGPEDDEVPRLHRQGPRRGIGTRAVMAELADRGAIWGSVLSVNAFPAIRSVGFEPVGQVFGAAVYPLTATAAVSCPGTATPSLTPRAPGRVTGWAGS